MDGGGNGDGGTNAGPVNAFTGAPAFVAKVGPNTVKGDHGNGGNPAKQACQSCHGARASTSFDTASSSVE